MTTFGNGSFVIFRCGYCFVVLEQHVESRLVLFDEVGLEHERLDLVVDDDEFEIGDDV